MSTLLIVASILVILVVIGCSGLYYYSSTKAPVTGTVLEVTPADTMQEAVADAFGIADLLDANRSAVDAAAAATTTATIARRVRPPPLTGTSANELGKYGMAPWGSAAAFVAPDAQWIWNSSTAATSAPVGTGVKFSSQYFHDADAPIAATLHVVLDDRGAVKVNGQLLNGSQGHQVAMGGWETKDYSKMPVTLQPGNNTVDIFASNLGGPAGALAALVDAASGSILLHTNGTWVTSTDLSPRLPTDGVTGRYAGLFHKQGAVFNVAEIIVMANGVNIAKGKTVQMSSMLGGYPGANAVDGNETNFAHTLGGEELPWILIDLGSNAQKVDQIIVVNRTDCCRDRIAGATAVVLDETSTQVLWRSDAFGPNGVNYTMTLPATAVAQR
ncbi:hypothetical protein COO60DRAFT_1463575 [Scenedesmus sp. NREL 46B-D3]|nr:hypothetical protein COO60DRAFT_1463575 [Scenedesmus sp. NREL 46B-D3]